MERETFLFLIAAGTGAGLFLFYRVLGIFRWMFPGRRSVAFFDLLYWILSGSVVFAELYQYNEGVLRLFLLPAVFLGAFLMNSLLKRLLFLVKRGKISIIMENRFCNWKRESRLKKSKKKKKNTRILNNYLGMALISVVVVLLLGVLTVQSNELKAKISSYDTRAAEIRTSIEEEQDRTKQIDEEKEYMQTDEYVAEIARDRLGLVKSNEIVFEEEK